MSEFTGNKIELNVSELEAHRVSTSEIIYVKGRAYEATSNIGTLLLSLLCIVLIIF